MWSEHLARRTTETSKFFVSLCIFQQKFFLWTRASSAKGLSHGMLTIRMYVETLRQIYLWSALFKDIQWQKDPWNKTPTLLKSMNIDICVVGTSNQIFMRGSQTPTTFSKKRKKLLPKLRSFSYVDFVLTILFLLTHWLMTEQFFMEMLRCQF